MSQSGVAYPDHPDNYGSRMQRELRGAPDDILFDAAPEVTDEEADAMWQEERVFRALVAVPHDHRCGHECSSRACNGRTIHDRDPLCMACVLAEKDWR